MNKLKKVLNFSLSGNYNEFSLEHRTFNLLSALNILGFFIALIGNYLIDLAWFIQVTLLGMTLIVGIIYYFSRFRKVKLTISLIILSSIDYLFFSLLWFWNGGIEGSLPYLFFAIQNVLILVVKRPWRVIFITFFIIFTLILIEYYNPQLVIPYPSRTSQFIDYGFGFLVTSILVGWAIITLKNDFNHQRILVDNQNKLLKEQNEEIRQQAEEIRQQNEVLTYIDIQRNKLFSIIAHDFRSPLATIQTVMGMLIDDDLSIELSTEDKKQIAVELAREISYTNNFVDNLLNWAKNQMQENKIQPIVFALHKVIEENFKIVRLQASQKQIRLINELNPDIYVYADLEMTRLVVRNLISNALKFTYAKGEIRIWVKIQTNELICAIQDNGKGMSEIQQTRLFDNQLNYSKGTANEKGSGLGLLLCKDFIEKNNGKIWFESIEKEGSTFYFSLPIAH